MQKVFLAIGFSNKTVRHLYAMQDILLGLSEKSEGK